MSNIISRLTMKNKGCLFVDRVSNRQVCLYVDKYNQKYMANYPFFAWSFRCKHSWGSDALLECVLNQNKEDE